MNKLVVLIFAFSFDMYMYPKFRTCHIRYLLA